MVAVPAIAVFRPTGHTVVASNLALEVLAKGRKNLKSEKFMPRTKTILIAGIVIVMIGLGVYFVLTSQKPSLPVEMSETQTPEAIPAEEGSLLQIGETREFQGMRYEIVNIGFNQAEGIKRGVYDIITGKLTEEQAKTLAEKIVGDITTEDPSIKEINLLFYSDKSAAAVGKYDVAYVVWVPNEISVRMIKK